MIAPQAIRGTLLSRLVLLGFLVVLAGCSSDEPTTRVTTGGDSQAATTSVSLQLNWYPEAEHGGVYDAQARGLFADAGLSVEIRPGGRATPVAPELSLGRCQFAVTNADDVILFREQGAKIVAVMAAMQDNPRCILVREESPARSLDQLSGMTLQRQPGRGFLEFLRSEGLLDQVREVPYGGTVVTLVSDPNVAIQAYSIAEPFLAMEQGVKVRPLMVSDRGWNPYCSVLATTEQTVRDHPDLVRRVVAAVVQGWQGYAHAPAPANALILAANRHGMTADALQFGGEAVGPLVAPDGNLDVVGTMTAERWQTMVDQMRKIGLVSSADLKANECYTNEFLPTRTSE